jgi:hypothetical protein
MTSKQLNIVLGIVVVILLGILVFVLLRNDSQKETVSQQDMLSNNDTKPVQPINTQPTTQAPAAEASDWRVYTNSKYGFSIEVPKDWVAKDTTTGVTFVSPQTKLNEEKRLQDCNDKDDTTLCNSNGVPVDFSFSSKSADVNVGTIKEVTYNGVVFTEYEAQSMFSEKHYKITYAGKLYDFSALGTNGQDVLPQILSTLKFTK